MYEDAKLSGDSVRMRQLCNNPQLSKKDAKVFGTGTVTLEQMRKIMVEKRKVSQKHYEEKLAKAKDMQIANQKAIEDLTKEMVNKGEEEVGTDDELSGDEREQKPEDEKPEDEEKDIEAIVKALYQGKSMPKHITDTS